MSDNVYAPPKAELAPGAGSTRLGRPVRASKWAIFCSNTSCSRCGVTSMATPSMRCGVPCASKLTFSSPTTWAYSHACTTHTGLPSLSVGGVWKEVDWQTALEYVANGLKNIKNDHGAKSIGALVSPHSTLEELYLTGALVRGLGSDNIDYRLRNAEFAAPEGIRWLGASIASLSTLQRVLVVGSNLRKDHPLLHAMGEASSSSSTPARNTRNNNTTTATTSNTPVRVTGNNTTTSQLVVTVNDENDITQLNLSPQQQQSVGLFSPQPVARRRSIARNDR
eukprot:gene36528-45045_t